jgi:hypothetical protein
MTLSVSRCESSGLKWSRGEGRGSSQSVDQWSQIRITWMRSRIRIRVKVKSRIRIRIKVMRIRNPDTTAPLWCSFIAYVAYYVPFLA